MTLTDDFPSRYYAKLRRVQYLAEQNYFKNAWIVEVRDVSHMAEIKSEILQEKFNTKQQAEEFIKSKNYPIARTWKIAEQIENVYRDGNQNIYRSKGTKTTGIYDLPAEDQAEIDRSYEEQIEKERAKSPTNISLF